MYPRYVSKGATSKVSRTVRLNPKFTDWIPGTEQERQVVQNLAMPKFNTKLQMLASYKRARAATTNTSVTDVVPTPERFFQLVDPGLPQSVLELAELEYVRKHCAGCGECGLVFHNLYLQRKQKLASRVANMMATGKLCFMHSAFVCPLTRCPQVVGACNFLEHMLRNHGNVQIRPIFDNSKPFVIELDVEKVKQRGGIMCAMIMMYGGKTDNCMCRPVTRGIAMPNGFLPPAYGQYKQFLPIVMLVSHINWGQVYGPNDGRPLEKRLDVTCMWLVSGHTLAPLHGTITVFNREQTMSLSTLMGVRNIHDEQDPTKFLRHSWDAMRVNHCCMVDMLGETGDKHLIVEASIHDI